MDHPVIYDDIGRWYRQEDGQYYPSVTTVIGWGKRHALAEWADRVGIEEAERIKAKAARRGTTIHELMEDLLANDGVLSERSKAVLMKDRGLKICFNKMKEVTLQNVSFKDEFISERAYASHELRIAGRCDLIGTSTNGRRTIFDFKTSRGSTPREHAWNIGYFQQLTAYSIMHEELTGEKIDDLMLLFAIDGIQVPVSYTSKREHHEQSLIELVRLFHQEIPGPDMNNLKMD